MPRPRKPRPRIKITGYLNVEDFDSADLDLTGDSGPFTDQGYERLLLGSQRGTGMQEALRLAQLDDIEAELVDPEC